MKKLFLFASIAICLASCGGSGSNRAEDSDAVKAAKAEMDRLGDLHHSITAERARAQQAGNQAEANRLAPIEADYCEKANNAIREYYRVLDYEREKINRQNK